MEILFHLHNENTLKTAVWLTIKVYNSRHSPELTQFYLGREDLVMFAAMNIAVTWHNPNNHE